MERIDLLGPALIVGFITFAITGSGAWFLAAAAVVIVVLLALLIIGAKPGKREKSFRPNQAAHLAE